MTVQLPPESFAEAKSRLEAMAKEAPSGDGETTWDQRMADAFMALIRGGHSGAAASPYFVVVHVPAAALLDESGEASGARRRPGAGRPVEPRDGAPGGL